MCHPHVSTIWRTSARNGWDWFGSLGHPSKLPWVSHLAFVTAAMSLTVGQPNFAGCLAVTWATTLYIHFLGLLPPDRILPGADFTLRPSLAFSYIGSVTAWHSSSGHQPNFVAWYKEWNHWTFSEDTTYIRQGGHHVGHWPTFLFLYICELEVIYCSDSCQLCCLCLFHSYTYFCSSACIHLKCLLSYFWLANFYGLLVCWFRSFSYEEVCYVLFCAGLALNIL